MTNAATAIANKPAWVDLGTKDATGARDFYSKLFGWDIQVSPDPQYGGYGRALSNGKDAAGIGPLMSPDQPTAWALYVGTDDVDGLADKVKAAGGTCSWRRSTWATRAGWPSSPIRPVPRSRPGSRSRWAASRPRAGTPSAGPS